MRIIILRCLYNIIVLFYRSIIGTRFIIIYEKKILGVSSQGPRLSSQRYTMDQTKMVATSYNLQRCK